MGEAAEGDLFRFGERFFRFWYAVREPKRKTKSKMLARRDGCIRAPQGISSILFSEANQFCVIHF